ncbi:MAG: hypothetical protein KatS3mg130_1865 [Candidatus Sumerlaea sp.]|jgi:hypothetical protein|nr:hypothetical protein [Candidatus Sumerlaea chitinivorans]GIX45457.1 MAG: hypothetical protein KatS3mg130_1865 [Candidatus Sumerlaea sp.]
MSSQVRQQPLEALLASSSATPEFQEAVRALTAGHTHPLIQFPPALPKVKILRAIMKLLEEAPSLKIQNVHVQGFSGCSDFVGKLTVNDGEAEFEFHWDCRWRAEQEQMLDWWGNPDQARAAREFGYQCFRKFERTR